MTRRRVIRGPSEVVQTTVTCMVESCGVYAIAEEALDTREALAAARRHVRETGHAVHVEQAVEFAYHAETPE